MGLCCLLFFFKKKNCANKYHFCVIIYDAGQARTYRFMVDRSSWFRLQLNRFSLLSSLLFSLHSVCVCVCVSFSLLIVVCSQCVCKGHLAYSNVLPKIASSIWTAFVRCHLCTLWFTEANVYTTYTYIFLHSHLRTMAVSSWHFLIWNLGIPLDFLQRPRYAASFIQYTTCLTCRFCTWQNQRKNNR